MRKPTVHVVSHYCDNWGQTKHRKKKTQKVPVYRSLGWQHQINLECYTSNSLLLELFRTKPSSVKLRKPVGQGLLVGCWTYNYVTMCCVSLFQVGWLISSIRIEVPENMVAYNYQVLTEAMVKSVVIHWCCGPIWKGCPWEWGMGWWVFVIYIYGKCLGFALNRNDDGQRIIIIIIIINWM